MSCEYCTETWRDNGNWKSCYHLYFWSNFLNGWESDKKWDHWNDFPARDTLSAKKSSNIPINDPLDQKCSIHSQPIAKANSESSKPNKVHLEILANQIFSIFLFLVLYPKNNFLPFALFCSYPQRSCLLHEVLNTAFDSTKLFFKHTHTHIYIYI